jgi:hypothetical protein
MSSIQQLHLAQQQVHAQLSAPTMISSRQEIDQYQHSSSQTYLKPSVFKYATEPFDQMNFNCHDHNNKISSNEGSLSPPGKTTNPRCSVQSTQTTSRSPPTTTIINFSSLLSSPSLNHTSNDQQQTRRSVSLTPSSIHYDSSISPSDEQLRLYLTETLQREKDSAV